MADDSSPEPRQDQPVDRASGERQTFGTLCGEDGCWQPRGHDGLHGDHVGAAWGDDQGRPDDELEAALDADNPDPSIRSAAEHPETGEREERRCENETSGGQRCERPWLHLDHCHFAPCPVPCPDSVLRPAEPLQDGGEREGSNAALEKLRYYDFGLSEDDAEGFSIGVRAGYRFALAEHPHQDVEREVEAKVADLVCEALEARGASNTQAADQTARLVRARASSESWAELIENRAQELYEAEAARLASSPATAVAWDNVQPKNRQAWLNTARAALAPSPDDRSSRFPTPQTQAMRDAVESASPDDRGGEDS
jgi:hypothetical protein